MTINWPAAGTTPSEATAYQYDGLGRMIEEIQPQASATIVNADGTTTSGSVNPVTLYGYDNDGNVTQVTVTYATENSSGVLVNAASLGNPDYTTQTVYDNLGRKIAQVEPYATCTDDNGNNPATTRPTTLYRYNAAGELQWELDPDFAAAYVTTSGSTVTINWSALTSTPAESTSYVYDKLGRQTEEIEPQVATPSGNVNPTTTTLYDAVGNVLAVTNALGYTTRYQYDVENRQIAEIDPATPCTEPNGSVAVVQPTTSYAYDLDGNLLSTTDPDGNTTRYEYDALNRQVASIDALGNVTKTAYDAYGNVAEVIDPLLRSTEYVYDNLGRKIEEIDPAAQSVNDSGTLVTMSPTTYYGYDEDGNLKYVTDPRGDTAAGGAGAEDPNYTTWYFYDALDRQVCVIDALAGLSTTLGMAGAVPSGYAAYSTSTTYDPYGNVSSTTDPTENTTMYVYDNLGRQTTEIQPYVWCTDQYGNTTYCQPTTSYTYDANGNPTSTTDPDNHTSWTRYDALNRVVGQTTADADGNGGSGAAGYTTVTTYDALGNTLTVTDPDNNTTKYAYDPLNRTTSVTNLAVTLSGGTHPTTTNVYDAAGNLVQTTDPDNHVIQYTYDADNRQTQETWVGGNRTIATTYDAAGEVLSVVDPGGATYLYAYDADGRATSTGMAPSDMSQKTTPDDTYHASLPTQSGGTTYYAAGYSFTGMSPGNVITASVSASGFAPELLLESPSGEVFALSDAGAAGSAAALTAELNQAGTWTVVVQGSAEGTKNPSGSYTLNITFGYNVLSLTNSTYDAAGNVTDVQDGAGTTSYAYDALDRLTSAAQTISGSVNEDAAIAYNLDSSLATITRYADNGVTPVVTSNYVYDADGRLTSLTHTLTDDQTVETQNGQTVPIDPFYDWTYDQAGQVTSTNSMDYTTSYTYDASNQLQTASNAKQTLLNESDQSDANGNRTAYTTAAGNEVTFDGTYHYQYDNAGNEIARWVAGGSGETAPGQNSGDSDITIYGWDFRNRLVSARHYATYASYEGSSPDQSVSFTYDYLNRRIEETTTASGTTTYDHLVYDGSQPLLEFSGQGTSATVSHRYLDAAAIGQVLADDQFQVNSVAGAPLGTIWQLPDNEGTIRDLVWLNHQGSWITTHQVYSSFGVLEQSDPLVVMGTPPQPVVVTTIFGYAGGIYDATLGMVQFVDRWYDPNTARFLSPDPTGFAGGLSNLYCYCGNDPLTQTDPTGDQQGYAGSGVVFAAGYNQAPISLTESFPSAGAGGLDLSPGWLTGSTVPNRQSARNCAGD